jgi:hypothetical protein
MGYEVTYGAHSALPPGQDSGPDTTTYSHYIYQSLLGHPLHTSCDVLHVLLAEASQAHPPILCQVHVLHGPCGLYLKATLSIHLPTSPTAALVWARYCRLTIMPGS